MQLQRPGRPTCIVLALVLLCLAHPSEVAGQSASTAAAAGGVRVSGAWPLSISQYVPTTVRVTLSSDACSQWGQGAVDGAQLVLQRATAQGRSLTFKSSQAADSSTSGSGSSSSSSRPRDSSCTTLDFPVLLDGSTKRGAVAARLLLPKPGVDWVLQEPLVVVVPPLVSVVQPIINVTSDQHPFDIPVLLSQPAPAGGVAVRLELQQAGVAKVDPAVLTWPEGSQGQQSFTLALLAAPEDGVLTARLTVPSGGAVLHPAAATAQVVVQSPIVSFITNLGYYRGLNSSSPPRLTFALTGSSAFPVEFAFSTFLLPGSKPSSQPCHPFAPACSVADQEAVDNVTLSGSRYVVPGQLGIPPVDLPLTWARLPPEAELRVGLRISGIRNVQVAPQVGDVAAIVFGTPPGHCPPGAVLSDVAGDLAANSSGAAQPGATSSDRPTYTHVAALQELALVLEPDRNSSSAGGTTFSTADRANHRRLLAAVNGSRGGTGGLPADLSKGTSSNWRSKAGVNKTYSSSRAPGAVVSLDQRGSAPRTSGPAAVVMPSAAAAAKAAVRSAAAVLATNSSSAGSSSSSSSSSSSTLDLDPPFRPLVERYIALMPPAPAAGQLMMSSSRWGDVVVVDTTACGELDSARYTVAWPQGQQLWREFYPLAGQNVPCWIRVAVFTRLTDSSASAADGAGVDDSAGEQQSSGSGQGVGLKDPTSAVAAAGGFTGSHRRPLQAAAPSSAANAAEDTAGAAAAAAPGNSSSSNGSVTSPLAGQINTSNSTPGSSSSSSNSGPAASSSSSSPSVWDLPSDFVLYRSYTVRFVPLRPPEQLSLRAITFSNNSTTVIACGVPEAFKHLFVQHTAQQLRTGSSTGAVRPASIMSSSYAAASSKVASAHRSNSSSSSGGGNGTAGAAPPGEPAAGSTSSFQALPADAPAADKAGPGPNSSTTASSGGSSTGPPPALVAAPGVDVQVAYLLMKPPGSSGGDTAAEVAAASRLPNRLRLQQYSVLDRVVNRTIVWSRYTSAVCAQDRYILLPLAQIKPDMRVMPELVDPAGLDAGVKIAMSTAAVALPGSGIANSSSGGDGGSSSSSSSHLGVPSDGSSSVSSWLLAQKFQGGAFVNNGAAAEAAAAAVDGGKGYGGPTGGKALRDEVWCSSRANGTWPKAAKAAGADGVGGSSSSSSSSDSNCRLQLPGLTAELPVILTADEGRSSKTYTMLLYSNATAAAAVQDLVLPQEAAAAGGRGGRGSSSQAADAAAQTAAYFAARPRGWPASPAQGPQCSVCPNGTYSTRTDSVECKVCPPGKYAASPFSTGCLYCPPGSFSYYWGAPTCRTCLPGTYAASAGSLFCDICRDGTTTRSEGATQCEVTVTGGSAAPGDTPGTADVAILLSFGLLLDGTNLESVSRSLTGINGSSEGIVGVLVRGDTATALNISLGRVQVLAVQQIGSRQLLVNVSASLPVSTDQAAAAQQDLSADPLIQRLIDDPNTFLRTTQTLGAESASVQDITTQMTQRAKWRHHLQLHAILWPTLAGALLLLGCGGWGWRRRRQWQQTLQQMATGRPEPAASAAVRGLGGLFGTSLQQRGARTSANALPGQAVAGWGGGGGGGGSGPGWFYGEGFMQGGTAGPAVGRGLDRESLNSSDAGDGMGRRSTRGAGGMLRLLHRLLSSRIRIVFRVQQGGGGAAGRSGRDSSGASSPVSSHSPGRSSCGTSETDSMERGCDEYRVKVVVRSSDDGSPGGAMALYGSRVPHDVDGLREESFAAMLRAQQEQRQQLHDGAACGVGARPGAGV